VIVELLWMMERGLIMPLTEIEAHLIDALKMDGVRKGAAMAVCLMLKEEPQRMDMIEYLLNEPDMTDEKALDMARKIAG
jgi:hypothetical protein